jgi:hypothetical protein
MAGKDGWKDVVAALKRRNGEEVPEDTPQYRTKTGRIITDEEIEGYVLEAEHGYTIT